MPVDILHIHDPIRFKSTEEVIKAYLTDVCFTFGDSIYILHGIKYLLAKQLTC